MTVAPAPTAPPRSAELPEPGQAMRVSATSDPSSLGGAIASIVRRDSSAILSAIGAAAVNQAVKGVAIAAGFLILEDVSVALVPTFEMVDIDGNERTSIRLRVVCL